MMSSTLQPAACVRKGPALLDWAPSLAAVVVSLVAVTAVGLAPRNPQQIAAVFPPWWTAEQSLAAAKTAGQAAVTGAAPFVAIVWSTDGALAERLRAAGAVLLLDPGLTAACIG
jgi:hypothetical protein